MTFKIKGLDHVVLRTADMKRAIRFYRDILGCHEERRVEGIGLVQMRAGESLIDLIPVEDTPGTGERNMDHFAINIEPFEEAALRAHLSAHGLEVGEVARRYGARGFGPAMYMTDPDGNTVELKGPPEA